MMAALQARKGGGEDGRGEEKRPVNPMLAAIQARAEKAEKVEENVVENDVKKKLPPPIKKTKKMPPPIPKQN